MDHFLDDIEKGKRLRSGFTVATPASSSGTSPVSPRREPRYVKSHETLSASTSSPTALSPPSAGGGGLRSIFNFFAKGGDGYFIAEELILEEPNQQQQQGLLGRRRGPSTSAGTSSDTLIAETSPSSRAGPVPTISISSGSTSTSAINKRRQLKAKSSSQSLMSHPSMDSLRGDRTEVIPPLPIAAPISVSTNIHNIHGPSAFNGPTGTSPYSLSPLSSSNSASGSGSGAASSASRFFVHSYPSPLDSPSQSQQQPGSPSGMTTLPSPKSASALPNALTSSGMGIPGLLRIDVDAVASSSPEGSRSPSKTTVDQGPLTPQAKLFEKCIKVNSMDGQSHIIDVSNLKDGAAIRNVIAKKFHLTEELRPFYSIYGLSVEGKLDTTSEIDDDTLLEICKSPNIHLKAHLFLKNRLQQSSQEEEEIAVAQAVERSPAAAGLGQLRRGNTPNGVGSVDASGRLEKSLSLQAGTASNSSNNNNGRRKSRTGRGLFSRPSPDGSHNHNHNNLSANEALLGMYSPTTPTVTNANGSTSFFQFPVVESEPKPSRRRASTARVRRHGYLQPAQKPRSNSHSYNKRSSVVKSDGGFVERPTSDEICENFEQFFPNLASGHDDHVYQNLAFESGHLNSQSGLVISLSRSSLSDDHTSSTHGINHGQNEGLIDIIRNGILQRRESGRSLAKNTSFGRRPSVKSSSNMADKSAGRMASSWSANSMSASLDGSAAIAEETEPDTDAPDDNSSVIDLGMQLDQSQSDLQSVVDQQQQNPVTEEWRERLASLGDSLFLSVEDPGWTAEERKAARRRFYLRLGNSGGVPHGSGLGIGSLPVEGPGARRASMRRRVSRTSTRASRVSSNADEDGGGVSFGEVGGVASRKSSLRNEVSPGYRVGAGADGVADVLYGDGGDDSEWDDGYPTTEALEMYEYSFDSEEGGMDEDLMELDQSLLDIEHLDSDKLSKLSLKSSLPNLAWQGFVPVPLVASSGAVSGHATEEGANPSGDSHVRSSSSSSSLSSIFTPPSVLLRKESIRAEYIGRERRGSSRSAISAISTKSELGSLNEESGGEEGVGGPGDDGSLRRWATLKGARAGRSISSEGIVVKVGSLSSSGSSSEEDLLTAIESGLGKSGGNVPRLAVHAITGGAATAASSQGDVSISDTTAVDAVSSSKPSLEVGFDGIATAAESDTDMFSTEEEPRTHISWIKGDLIGKGSFGRVYYGVNLTTKDVMAVKQVELIPLYRHRSGSEAAKHRQRMVDALRMEILLLRELDHENIVRYLGFDVDANIVSVFLQYVDGGSVASMLSRFGKFDEGLVRHVSCQILSGLEYLHERCIIHRDIKGANILVDGHGVAKISDFNISKKNEYNMAYNTNSRMSLQGSVFWMAPEVVKGKGYSAKVDIWSLGCVTLEMLTGTHPWLQLNEMQTMWRLGKENAPPIPHGVLSDDAERFLEMCFTIEPESRPTAKELFFHCRFPDVDPNDFDFAACKAEMERRRTMSVEDEDDDDEDGDSDDDDNEGSENCADEDEGATYRGSDSTLVLTSGVTQSSD
ncbi:ATP binding [Blyttiomyces sp. JEL0837]|nr:ATP binding [Blyttiomyces sp. JEL0837]